MQDWVLTLFYLLQGAFKDTEMISLLASYGANPLIKNKEGKSPASIVGALPPIHVIRMTRALAGESDEEVAQSQSEEFVIRGHFLRVSELISNSIQQQ